jgi:phospholipase/carboxylesterase
VNSLKLRIAPKSPEPVDELPTGMVWIERGPQRAALFTPDEIDPGRRYPLLAVLHGAGRREELLMKAYRDEAERRQALFLVPRSFHVTWDLITAATRGAAAAAGGGAPSPRPDLDFLEYAYDLVFRRYPIDAERLGLVGYSDGASYALSVGLSNPHLFRAVMGWAAGFVAIENEAAAPGVPRPAVLVEYGTHDELFPFEQVAVPMREQLEAFGCAVTFRVDEGGRHWPSGAFQQEALDWFFSEPWQPRS